jgi:hypothetical protein
VRQPDQTGGPINADLTSGGRDALQDSVHVRCFRLDFSKWIADPGKS